MPSPDPSSAAARHQRAWIALTAALALHVADEAATGFLDFYNPLVLELRSRLGYFPMPTFDFGPWLVGLAILVVLLAALTPAVRRGARGTVAASWALAVIMLFNGLGHLVGSAYYRRWLPGATSAPLLVIASGMLAGTAWKRRRQWAQVARS